MTETDHDGTSSSEVEPGSTVNTGQKRTRTRTGCLNCRRRRRKCDETKPTCANCQQRNEVCERGMRLKFRAANAFTLPAEHKPTLSGPSPKRRRRSFEIKNVTPAIARSYGQTDTRQVDGVVQDETHDNVDKTLRQTQHPPAFGSVESDATIQLHTQEENLQDEAGMNAHPDRVELPRRLSFNEVRPARQSILTPSSMHQDDTFTDLLTMPISQGQTQDAAANLLYLRQTMPQHQNLPSVSRVSMGNSYISPTFSRIDPLLTPEILEDGIFLPGSVYHELHSTLRNHLMNESKNRFEPVHGHPQEVNEGVLDNVAHNLSGRGEVLPQHDNFESDHSHTPAELSKEEEYLLWKNWFDEIAGWLDKFDRHHHFQTTLPIMAKSHRHLECSMLAVSARQLEKMDSSMPTDRSLALYQEAIHLLLPQLPRRTTPVIASCVVLCVLEMLSCSPKAWRRHLDGCANLMEAAGMGGFSGGVEQALFWCFARMDVCGGFISDVKTLIPAGRWASKIDLDADIGLFRATPGFDMYANHIVYLCARILELLHAESARAKHDRHFASRWLRLWRYVQDWEAQRPPEMLPVASFPSLASSSTSRSSSTASSPFPTVLFSNAAAISGNQMYHTASILMLRNRPPSMPQEHSGTSGTGRELKHRSILWHARQICGISKSNDHHGAWTNSVQPLWIAGQCMSHPTEHAAIFDLLTKIENESGWATKWRMDDLREFWGDLD